LKRLTPKKRDGSIYKESEIQPSVQAAETTEYSDEGVGRDRSRGAEGEARKTLRRKDQPWTKLWKAVRREAGAPKK
jgi:hypothetical protein